jgi:Putative methyltransferase
MKAGESFPIDSYVDGRQLYALLAPFVYSMGAYAHLRCPPRVKKDSNHRDWRFSSFFFNKNSETIEGIQKNVGNASALHLLYLLRRRQSGKFLERFWTNIPIIQGVQNRAVLVRSLVKKAVRRQYLRVGEVNILELAAGLAEPLIWALKDLEHEKMVGKVLLTDISRDSLEDACAIARSLELRVVPQIERLNLLKHSKVYSLVKKEDPHILEMIGFIDYLDDVNVLELLRVIQEALSDGATIIVGNVIPTWERYFIEKAYGWPKMYYRTPERLAELMREVRFREVTVEAEPVNRFCIGTATV